MTSTVTSTVMPCLRMLANRLPAAASAVALAMEADLLFIKNGQWPARDHAQAIVRLSFIS